jgi:hypothetical protein
MHFIQMRFDCRSANNDAHICGLVFGGYMPAPLGRSIRTFLALSLTAATLTAVSPPANAGDGGAIAAGILGGTALGFLAGTAAASPPPPPPPPVYYAPVYAAPPPRCWYEPQQVWTGYAYVIQRVRVCN